MIALLCFFLTLFASPFKSRSLLRSPPEGIDHFHYIPFPKSISANHPKPQPRFEGAFSLEISASGGKVFCQAPHR
jgi:hypothetical protein